MARKIISEIKKSDVSKILYGKKPTSLTQISKALGYKGSISGDLSKKIRKWFPTIDSWLKRNAEDKKRKGKKKGGSKNAAKTKAKPIRKTKYRRHPENPFTRENSSYSKCFNILASFRKGLHREKLAELLAKETGKRIANAKYDVAVLVSAKESNTGPRHKSCKDGFWIKRESDHVQMVID